MTADLNTNDSIKNLKGVGDKTAGLLGKLGIYTINDLILYYPRDYRQYDPPVTADDTAGDDLKAMAYKVRITGQPSMSRHGRMTYVTINIISNSKSLKVVWYNSPFVRQQLIPGSELVFYGKVALKKRTRVLEHPEIYTPAQYEAMMTSLQPVYALTEGVSQKMLTKLIRTVLDEVQLSSETLPSWIRSRYHLSEINFAVRQIHFPSDRESMLLARKRIVFEEFLSFILAMKLMKDENQTMPNNYPVHCTGKAESMIRDLPYKLTNAQHRVCTEIMADLGSDKAMNRLVQGDVGSGKTLIAVITMYIMASSGYQCCMMAPTEVLADQHYETVTSLLAPYGIRTTLLTGSMTAAGKRKARQEIADHKTDIIIGTQAVFQEKVDYDRLGLIITDEQHRFGVRQRRILADKSSEGQPHVLVMSATPIPRTLALIIYGDLDVSVVDEKPVGRLPVKNCVVGISYRQTAYRFMQKQIAEGHQVYIICPMVEDSERIEAENVQDYAERLKQIFPADINIAFLHGKMKPKEKQEIMQAFAEGRIHILVSTTVVEVGVDVPNATVMLIENSERYGLAQLHQLRGRIGRGQAQSYCIFMYGQDNQKTKQRLDIMQQTNDGFVIAEEDMKLRGPGDMFGLRQSGSLEFALGDIYTDSGVLMQASEAANTITEDDPGLVKEKNEAFRALAMQCMSGNTESITL